MTPTEITIQTLGPQGDGIGYGRHGRIYVDRAVPGDRLRAEVRRNEKGVVRGEIVDIVSPSPFRQAPPCPHYAGCGNCTLQHLRPDFYREWKREVVRTALLGQGLRPRHWLETKFVGPARRRRATFTAYKKKGRVTVGYYRRRSQIVSEIDSCLIVDPHILIMRERLRPHLDAILTPEKPLDLFFQTAGATTELVMTGPVGRAGAADAEVTRVAAGWIQVSGLARIGWRASEREAVKPLAGRGSLRAEFGPLKVVLPPAAFLQPTLEGERALVEAVLSGLPRGGKFADLFAGCGTFSGPMLERGEVNSYESVVPAVRALTHAAGGFALKAFRRDLVRHPLRREELNRYDAVVFDPPRAGCREQVRAMASSRVRTLVGVSCNPATFAHDARILAQGGYRLHSVQIVDQFLWSHHVEVVGVFTKGS